MGDEKIIKNRAYCNLCNMEVESKSVHDFRSCGCGNLSVDGGREYLRRLFREQGAIVDTSIVISDAPGGVTDDQLYDLAKTVEDRVECHGGYWRHHGHHMDFKDVVGVLRHKLQELKLL